MVSATGATFAPPIPEARRWIDGVTFPPDRPLINLSQAAPADPPAPALRAALAEAAADPAAHAYGPVLGNPDLRAALAARWSRLYEATIAPGSVAITSGCNQAFAATISAIAGPGDAVMLPVPWYFNHKMWLDMAGITAVPIPTDTALLPDLDAARAAITPRTRAIAIATPNNPAGVEYPAPLLDALYRLAREAGLHLVIDETYRDFHSQPGPPHGLLQAPGAADTLIQLYSFSKAYRLTGHRIGAIIGAPALLREVEKFIDTVTICPSQMGQRAALFGLTHLDDWLAQERAEILNRRAAIAKGMARIEPLGWRLRGLGAYFAYLEHPFAAPSDRVAQDLVRDASLLMLPATMFVPPGDPSGARHLRLAFANADAPTLGQVFDRLAALDWPA